jgi:hypothetical protein
LTSVGCDVNVSGDAKVQSVAAGHPVSFSTEPVPFGAVAADREDSNNPTFADQCIATASVAKA